MSNTKIREGDLYKTVTVADKTFEIRYGYSCDAERLRWEPTPIYPDFRASPEYTAKGYPFATAYQDICEYYIPKPNATGENWCDDCILFDKLEEYIGICNCKEKNRNTIEGEKLL